MKPMDHKMYLLIMLIVVVCMILQCVIFVYSDIFGYDSIKTLHMIVAVIYVRCDMFDMYRLILVICINLAAAILDILTSKCVIRYNGQQDHIHISYDFRLAVFNETATFDRRIEREDFDRVARILINKRLTMATAISPTLIIVASIMLFNGFRFV